MMPPRVRIEVKGVSEVAQTLGRVGTNRPAFRKAMQIAAAVVRREYRSELPRLTGYMRKRIKVRITEQALTLGAEIYPAVYYALFLERGVTVTATRTKVA